MGEIHKCTSLQVYKESGKYIWYPILCYVGLRSISRCQTPFWILSVAGNYLYVSLRGWAPPNVSPNLHKWACSQAVCLLTIMENGCAQGTGLNFSTWRWHTHQGKVSTLPVPKLYLDWKYGKRVHLHRYSGAITVGHSSRDTRRAHAQGLFKS